MISSIPQPVLVYCAQLIIHSPEADNHASIVLQINSNISRFSEEFAFRSIGHQTVSRVGQCLLDDIAYVMENTTIPARRTECNRLMKDIGTILDHVFYRDSKRTAESGIELHKLRLLPEEELYESARIAVSAVYEASTITTECDEWKVNPRRVTHKKIEECVPDTLADVACKLDDFGCLLLRFLDHRYPLSPHGADMMNSIRTAIVNGIDSADGILMCELAKLVTT